MEGRRARCVGVASRSSSKGGFHRSPSRARVQGERALCPHDGSRLSFLAYVDADELQCPRRLESRGGGRVVYANKAERAHEKRLTIRRKMRVCVRVAGLVDSLNWR